jgi:hypothetical protein
MSLTWDAVNGHGLLGGAEDCLVALALTRPPPDHGAGDGATATKDEGGGGWSLQAVRTRTVTNPGLGIVRQANRDALLYGNCLEQKIR